MVSKKQLGWRRNKVSELLVRGFSQYDIADVLKVSQPTINNDVKFLREQARLNLQTHLNDRLPGEFENCMSGINRVLKMAWDIASCNDEYNCGKNVTIDDNKTRLQALALANDCYKFKMDLVTNGIVITDALKFVQHKKKELTKISDYDPDRVQEVISNTNLEPNQKENTTNKAF